MKKSAIQTDPGYFRKYVEMAGDGDLNDELKSSIDELDSIAINELERVGDDVYAPGKWTLKMVLQHMIDTERVFQYRALRFARKDQTPLHGFDQDDFAAAALATVSGRDIAGLIEELKVVRRSTVLLFRSLTDEDLLRTGTASGTTLSVLALGFIMAGHQLHHLRIIRERYLPLAS